MIAYCTHSKAVSQAGDDEALASIQSLHQVLFLVTPDSWRYYVWKTVKWYNRNQ